MFTGSTINELMGMVERVEANLESARRVQAEIAHYTTPMYTVYSLEHVQQIQREASLVGVA